MPNKGWLFTGVNEPLQLVDGEIPTPGDHQAVVAVASAGLCHSDISIMEGLGTDWTSGPPLILGHEVAGTIVELGSGVTGFSVGDRVALALLDGDAAPGWSNPGISRDGGYEQFAIAELRELVRVPDNVSLSQAAPATDAASTAHRAVMIDGQVTDGMIVGIIGMGGLGLNAVQIALAAGAEVHGVDTNREARERGSALGATSVHTDVSDLAQYSPDVILDFAGFGETTAAAIEAVRKRGTVVQVGLGKLESTINIPRLVLGAITLVGTAGSTKEDLETVLQMISDGILDILVEEIPFDALPDGIRRLSAGEVVGRLVLDVASA